MFTLSPVMQKFVLHWGEMGTRWGINRTMAQIHALLYISPRPLNAEEIAAAAEELGALGFAVGFLPDSDKVIIATELLNYREFQVLEFTAPTEPGDYDFLCTFPNHWQTMRGVMRVVN